MRASQPIPISDDMLFSISNLIPSPHIESVTYSIAVILRPSSSISTCSSIVTAEEADCLPDSLPVPLSSSALWSALPSLLSCSTVSATGKLSVISFFPALLSFSPPPIPIIAPPTSHSDAIPTHIQEHTCF